MVIRIFVRTFLVLFFLSSSSFAQALQDGGSNARNFVKKILVKGNRNIEPDTVKSKLKTSVGKPYHANWVREDIETLFQTGFFYDIIVDRTKNGEGWTLTYTVVEKPPITEIIFNGNSEVSEDELREAAGLKTYSILSQGKIQTAIDQMSKLYEEKGFFLSRIDYELKFVDEKKKDAHALHISIEENDKVLIKKVRIIGNKKIGDDTLKSRILSQEGGFFSSLSSSGSFKRESLEKDVQIILHSYYSEGFIQAKVSPPQTFISPDKKNIYITYYVTEGLQYDVGEISFSGELLFEEPELLETIQLDEKEIFSYLVLQSDISELQAKYGDLGYAFANVIPETKVIPETRKVNVNFRFDKGEKVYFGKINVVGNDKTKDKVIRRELKIVEGELYHETRKRKSLANIKRLGYFEDSVVFKTSTPANKPNVIDIEIQVTEKNTGSIQVGAGYSSFQKFVFNGQINQSNLFGNGQKLGFSLNYSKSDRLFSLSFTEPYFMDTQWSTGFELYDQKEKRNDYEQQKTGGAVTLGHPLGDYIFGSLRIKTDDTSLSLDPENGDPDLFPVDTVEGITNSATISLSYDKRDNRLTPKDGLYASASYEYAGIGGDKYFTKTSFNFRYYQKVIWELIWRNNITYRFLNSLNNKDLPFNELFLLGGQNSLRGFRSFSVGTRKYSVAKGEERPFGGKKQLYYNLEFEFPMIDEAGVRGVLFYDIGDAANEIELSELRSNYGFGFRWITPFGPLRFEWGFPIDRREELGEGPYNFEFSIGSPF